MAAHIENPVDCEIEKEKDKPNCERCSGVQCKVRRHTFFWNQWLEKSRSVREEVRTCVQI